MFKFGKFDVPKFEIIVETTLSITMVNHKPVVPGHLLVIPKRLVSRFCDLTHDEVSDLWVLAQRVGKKLEPHYKAEALTFTIQDGKVAGQTVEHVHIHILPRTKGDFLDNEIYKEIEKPREIRSFEEMKKEALELSLLFTDQ